MTAPENGGFQNTGEYALSISTTGQSLARPLPPQRDTTPHALTLAIGPDKTATVEMPLKPGLYEFLDPRIQFELATFVKLKPSDETKKLYAPQLEKFLVWMRYKGYTDFRQLTEWWLTEYQTDLLNPPEALQNHPDVTFNPLREETVDLYIKVVSGFVRFLADKKLIEYDAAKSIPKLAVRESGHEIIRMPDNDQWAIMQATLEAMPVATPGRRNRAARLRFCILFTYAMGLRITELVSHFHEDISWRKGRWMIGVVGKGNKRRWLSLEGNGLDDLAFEELVRYRRFLGLPDHPNGERLPLCPVVNPVEIVKQGKRKGIHINEQPVSQEAFRAQFRTFIEKDVMQYLYGNDEERKKEAYQAAWASFTVHCLRHRRITDLLEKFRKPLVWVQQYVGHTDPKTTSRYFHGDL